jgi:hypothetical protein
MSGPGRKKIDGWEFFRKPDEVFWRGRLSQQRG